MTRPPLVLSEVEGRCFDRAEACFDFAQHERLGGNG